jgi:hypothetical protein
MGNVLGIVTALVYCRFGDPTRSRRAAMMEDIKFEMNDFCVDGTDTSQALIVHIAFTAVGISDAGTKCS